MAQGRGGGGGQVVEPRVVGDPTQKYREVLGLWWFSAGLQLKQLAVHDPVPRGKGGQGRTYSRRGGCGGYSWDNSGQCPVLPYT